MYASLAWDIKQRFSLFVLIYDLMQFLQNARITGINVLTNGGNSVLKLQPVITSAS